MNGLHIKFVFSLAIPFHKNRAVGHWMRGDVIQCVISLSPSYTKHGTAQEMKTGGEVHHCFWDIFGSCLKNFSFVSGYVWPHFIVSFSGLTSHTIKGLNTSVEGTVLLLSTKSKQLVTHAPFNVYVVIM